MITYKLKIHLQSEREMDSDMVFTTGDKSGYVLEFSFYDNGAPLSLSACGVTVKTKRADGAVVIDNGTVDGNLAQYKLAGNAYEVAGEIAMEVALVRADGSCATTKVIYARVREGFGEEGLASSDNEPILAKLEAQAVTLRGAMNKLDASLTSHLSDPSAHTEAFAEERKCFNPLYCNALKGTQEGKTLTISDAVEGTPLSLSLYGATTETLANPDEEKSPDNPATLTGIGESGSVTVTVTDADGAEETIEIPLEKPLYGILNQETKQWVRQDEIRVENGKVLLIRKIGKVQITENFVECGGILEPAEGFVAMHVIQDWETYCKTYKARNSSNPERYVACPLFVSGWHNGSTVEKDIALGYDGAWTQRIGVRMSYDFLGLTTEATKAEKIEAFRAFCSTRDDFVVYYVLNEESVSEEDISETEAGRALLALTSKNGMTITNSEGAEMKAEYNRDVNKALEELSAAVVASV